MTVSFLRHSAFFGPEDANQYVLNIIGVGATGSWIAMLAARMGWHKFRVWDLDIVESHNLPNQAYTHDDIGKKKVIALKEQLLRFNPEIEIETHDYFFESEKHKELLQGPVIITVDSLSARKDIAEAIKGNWNVNHAFETRMGFTHAEINYLDCLDIESVENFQNLLKNDSEVTEAACNERIITTLTCQVAATVVHLLCALVTKDRNNNEVQIKNKIIFTNTPNLSVFGM
jgi:molybdopterin/thiamine biosynthesis adenylyltransferase